MGGNPADPTGREHTLTNPDWARRIRAEREARGWSHRTTAKAMCGHGATADEESLARALKRWEKNGRVSPHNRRLLARTFGTVEAVMFIGAPARSTPTSEPADILGRLRASDIDTDTLEALEATTERLGCDYSHQPPEVLQVEGRLWLTRITDLLDRRLTLAQHRDVLSLAGRVALLVGCVEFDMGLKATAEATRTAALSLGEESGDAHVVGWAQEMRAWYALTSGDYATTVKAADAGLAAVDATHSVGVQLAAHKAKAWARIGDRRELETALDEGRQRLEALPAASNLANHFVVDPSKWDFYVMDAYRQVGEDRLAATYADEVLRTAVDEHGTVVRPMRAAEAHITLGVIAARHGDLDGALAEGRAALGPGRKSLPSLRLHAGELIETMRDRFGSEPQVGQFEEELRALAA